MRLVYGLIARETILRLDGLVAHNTRALLRSQINNHVPG